MTVGAEVTRSAAFFDMQAAVGISKHVGGFEATRELLALCQAEQAREVLDVGCGIGVGPAYIARELEGDGDRRIRWRTVDSSDHGVDADRRAQAAHDDDEQLVNDIRCER